MKQAISVFYARFKSAPKWLRASTYLALTYVAYAVIIGLIAPAVIQSQAPKQLSQLLGRNVQLERVSINPFLLRARIENFAILEQNQQQAFTQFALLEVEVNFWQSLLSLKPTVDHLFLVQPGIQVQRVNEHNAFNFSDILETLASNNPPQAEDNTSEEAATNTIPAFKVNAVAITDGDARFADSVTGADLNYQQISLKLNNIDSQAYALSLPANQDGKLNLTENANQYQFSLVSADQSPLALNGQFQLSPFEIKGDVTLSDLTLTPYWPFAKELIAARLSDGSVSFSTNYHAKQVNDSLSYQTQNGQFSLSNLVFNDQQSEKVKLPSLVVSDIQLSGDEQLINIADISMQGLWFDAMLDKNGLDLAALFTPRTQTNGVAPKQDTSANQAVNQESTTPQWKVRLEKFSMADSDFNVLEKVQSQDVHWRVHPMTVTTKTIQSDLVEPIEYDVTLNVSSSSKQQPENARGSFATQGSVDVKALKVDGNLSIDSLDLTQLQPYLTPYLNIRLTKGALNTKGNYNVSGADDINFDGSLSVNNLLMRDTIKREPLVKWQKMSVDSLRFSSKQNQLIIKTVLLDAPYAKVMIAEDKRTNIGDIVVTKQSDTSTATTDKAATTKATVTTKGNSSKPMSVIVQQIKFANGSAFFADNSLTPNFASGIELLEGSIKNLSSTPGTKASVDIAGKIDKYAPVTLKGEINPLIEKPYLDLALVFRSVELTSVNPYSGTYAGYYIDKGQLSLDLNYRLDDNQLQGTNHLVIDQLQLGKPSDSSLATSLPITLAIAILQDRHGVIDLGVNVSGEVDDPDFSFGSVILKAFANIITKAVTAPFSLLADLVGTDEELNQVTFQAGIATLDDEEKQRIGKLAQALQERPILKVSVEGSVSAPDDSYALAEQNVQKTLLANSGLETLPEPFSASRITESAPLVDALEELAEEQLQLDIRQERDKVEQQLTEKAQGAEVTKEQIETVVHMGLYNQLVKATNVDKNSLSNLAAERAKAVKAYLVEEQQISPDRVFLLDSKTDLKTEKSGAELTVGAE
ncbi:DUF748 domain-containing protein [Vibrio plantisponsor]|jgi:hypothetical protein|uniref:DUF748 domain-containing protein n=1 Tax=Vibrio plantisponsor TaxID=664643 RepID=A0ABU4ILQ8_9VIBR|nr:DUF748 domain-containing protein [Vibrio plantisponsor]MDW6019498.1 DUF748 domain-containing protein [Vibrio plantisponsor]NNM39173.1 DUF748 domain-containing protein [Vibrio plantisponsor]PNH90931.1 hypothetical protein C1M56_01370 [Vibrio diazotrophicus]